MFRVVLALAIFSLIITQVFAEPTPPVMPKIQETPMPLPVELPAPPEKTGEVSDRPITANEAVQIALRRQPDITSARAGLAAAQGREKQVRSGLFPALDLSSSYNNSNGASTSVRSGGLSSGNYQASAAVKQLLFDFNHTRDLVKQSAALERSAGAGLNQVESGIVLQVKQAFYSCLQNERLVAVNEANLKNRQNHLELAKARLKAGLGLPADVVRAETAVAEAALNLNLAHTSSSLAEMDLAELMGVDPRTPIKLADSQEPEAAAEDLNALVEQALKQRPEMIQAGAAVEAAGHGLNAARTSNMPSLAAIGGYYQRGTRFPLSDNSMSMNLSVTFSPFDSGFTVGKVQEAGANLDSSQARLESVKLAVTTEVSRAYLNLKMAEQRVKTADAEVANAEEGVRLSQGRYSSGLGTFLDVLDAQAALLTANTNRVNAESAIQQARAALAYAVGEKRS